MKNAVILFLLLALAGGQAGCENQSRRTVIESDSSGQKPAGETEEIVATNEAIAKQLNITSETDKPPAAEGGEPEGGGGEPSGDEDPEATTPPAPQTPDGEGSHVVSGRLTVKGVPPQLMSNCEGVVLIPGSTETAGRLIVGTAIKKCSVKFNTPFFQPVCVASGAKNAVAVVTGLIDPLDSFTVSKVGGGNLEPLDIINYICLELARPPAGKPGHWDASALSQMVQIPGSPDSSQSTYTSKTVAQATGKKLLVKDPISEAVKDYCTAKKDQCLSGAASGGDAALCHTSYNVCVSADNCESISAACTQKGLDGSLCQSSTAQCEKKKQCKDQYDTCMQNASTGWEGASCSQNYQNCLK